MRSRHLIVMLKEPRAGRVKTRLGRDIGMVPAAWWFRHQTRALLRRLHDKRWRLWIAVTPDRDGRHSRFWPAHLPRITQERGDLGARMAGLFRAVPNGPALIVGGDIPGITPAHIERGFRSLGNHDAVFGPAFDGGYWLIGLNGTTSPPHGFLTDVRWSSQHALADSLATLPDRRIAVTDTLRDIDTGADLSA